MQTSIKKTDVITLELTNVTTGKRETIINSPSGTTIIQDIDKSVVKKEK